MQNDGGDLHPSGEGGPSSTSPTLNGNGTPRTGGIKRPREGEHDDLDVINAAEGPLQLSPSQRKRQAMTAATPPPLPSSPPVTIAIQDLLTSSQPSTRSSPPLASAPPFATYADISNAQPTLSQGTLPPLQPPSLSSSLALPSTAPLLIDPRQLDPSASSSSSAAAILLDNVPASSSSTTSPSPPSSPPELFASPADVPRVGGWIVPRRRAGWETPDVAEALRELLGTGADDDDEERVGQSLAERLAAEEGDAMQEDEEGEKGSPAAAAIPRNKKRLAPWCNPWRRAACEDDAGPEDEGEDADPEDEPLFSFLPAWRPSASIKVEEAKDVKPARPAAVEPAAPSSSQSVVETEEPPALSSSLPSTLVSGFSSRTASSSTSTLPTAATAMPSAPESGPSSPPAALETQAPPVVPPRAREYNGLSRSTTLCLLPKQEARDNIAHLIEHRGRQAPETKRHLAQRVRDGRLHLGGAPRPGEQDAAGNDKDEVRVVMMDLGVVDEEGRGGERLVLALSEDERIDVVGVPRAFAERLLAKPGPGVDEAAIRAKVEAELEERSKMEEEELVKQQQASSSTSAGQDASQTQPSTLTDGTDAATELTTLRTTLSTLETTHASLLTSHSSLESRLASAQSDLDLVRDLYQSSSNLSRTATLECDTLREENTALRLRAERGVAMHAERYRVERVKWEERERELLGRVRVLQGQVAREEVVRGRREEARERAWARGEEERERVRMREVRRAEELRELEEEAREVMEREEREREGEGLQKSEVAGAVGDEMVAMKVDEEEVKPTPVVVAPELALAHAPLSPPP